MSLPRVEYSVDKTSDPIKVTLTFKGNCSCDIKHDADQSVTAVAKKFQGIQEKKKESEVQPTENPQGNLMKRRREEFLRKGTYAALYGTLERKVACASMCTDHLLNQKRDKLRYLLLSEEENYAKEYIALCQAANEEKQAALRRTSDEIKRRTESERQEYIAKKIHELKIQDCEPARPLKSRQLMKMVKEDQLWQIKEKYVLKEAQREEERMYHDAMIKNLLDMKAKEEEVAKARWMMKKETKDTFIEQMRWKEAKNRKEQDLKELERKQMEEAVVNARKEEEKEMEERRRRNAERIADYQKYLEQERELRKKRQKEEEDIDRAFNKLMQIEDKREKEMASNFKEKLKIEMDNYMMNCKQIQRERELEEQRLDELIQEMNKKIKEQEDEQRAKMRAAKQELFTKVMRERAIQVQEKRDREKMEEEARNQEIELLNLQIEQQKRIRKDYEKRCEERRQEYGRQLKEQMRQFEEERKRKKEEEEEYKRQLILYEKKRIKEIEDIVQNSVSIQMHPMKEKLVSSPPMFDKPAPCPR